MELGSSQRESSDDFVIVERNPTGRFERSDEILEEGAMKTVYKAFDEENGLEVAWTQVDITNELFESEQQLSILHSKTHLLKSLKHRNVTRCYHSWVDIKNKNFNIITEILTSGNLRQYCKKHTHLDNKVIKRWARQILQGLDYLHRHSPPIVHRDLNCDNIFVNGNSGTVKIGDLELVTVLMADEEYDQMDDIYSFGMCMLQMVTRNSMQVYKKVNSGIKPATFQKVGDPELRQFIEKCMAPKSGRFRAIDLLNDPFLASTDSSPNTCSPSFSESVCSSIGTDTTSQALVEVVKARVTEMNIFQLQGKMKDRDSIAMTLWIANLEGAGEKAEFVFFLQTDTVFSVTEEMGKELKLSPEDAELIAQIMEELITEIVPGFGCHPAEAKGPQLCNLSKDYAKGEAQSSEELFLKEISGLSNEEQKQADDTNVNQNLDHQRKSDRKRRKMLAYKALSRCLRKLILHCGRQL